MLTGHENGHAAKSAAGHSTGLLKATAKDDNATIADGKRDMPRPHRVIVYEESSDGKLQGVGISKEGFAYLREKPPLSPLPSSTVGSYASQSNPEKPLAHLAARAFDADSTRSSQLSLLKGLFSRLDAVRSQSLNERALNVELQATRQRFDLIWSCREGMEWDWSAVPKLCWVTIYAFLCVVIVLAEISNASILTRQTGLGFEQSSWAVLAFCLPVILGPFLVAKWLNNTLSDRHRKRFDQAVSWFGIPLSLLVVFDFAWTLGALNEPVSLTSSEEATWHPPLWILLSAQMLLLVLMVTIAVRLFKDALQQFLQLEPKRNRIVEVSDREIIRLDRLIQQIDLLVEWARGIQERIGNERMVFVRNTLSDLNQHKLRLAGRLAQARLEE